MNRIKKSDIMVIPIEQLHLIRFKFYGCSNSFCDVSETWKEEKVLQGFRLYLIFSTFSPKIILQTFSKNFIKINSYSIDFVKIFIYVS